MKHPTPLITTVFLVALGSVILVLPPRTSQAEPTLSQKYGSATAPSPLGETADFGVVYYIPDSKVADDVALQQLQTIKDQGYRHINLSSWVWTLPKPGSPLRRRVDLILNWCDHNSLGVWLLHNIQYGTGEYGDFEQTVKDPISYVRPVVTDWIDALRGHSCVEGVQLGNEVGPAIPADAAKVPLYAQAFSSWLRARYGSVAAMNAAWGGHFASFEEVGLPAPDAPGRIDSQRFAKEQFGRFYGAIFKSLFKPVLGANLGYTTKTGPDPYLYRAFPEATVLGWDDMVANQPLWTLRALADCDPRPPFNNEIHLYHDSYNYFPSIELTRYRYFTDALSGEWMSSSFSWGAWNKPAIAAIHAATPRALADVSRLEPELRRFDAATRDARVAVLITEPLLDETSRNMAARPVLKPGEMPSQGAQATEQDAVPLEDAYAALASTGRPWRYLLDLDLTTQGRHLNALIVPAHRRFPLATLQQLVRLPRFVRIEWAGEWPAETEYGQLLPPDLLRKIQGRCRQYANLEAAASPNVDPELPNVYREQVIVPYNWWSPEKGNFAFGVSYPRVEARRVVEARGSTLVTLINHTREPVTLAGAASLPWRTGRQRVFDITDQPPVDLTAAPNNPITLRPFDVRLYRYRSMSGP